MYPFTLYEKKTGKINSVGYCQLQADVQAQEYFFEDLGSLSYHPDDRDAYYVVDEAFVLRPFFPATIDHYEIKADGIAQATISNMPDPCTIRVNDQDVTVTGGTLILKSRTPKVFILECDLWPYFPWAQAVSAVNS